MPNFLLSLTAVIFVSLLSFLGSLVFVLPQANLEKITFWLVSFATGALFGDVFFHLLPELSKSGFNVLEGALILSGILLFLITEKIVCWRHCHEPISKNHPHPLAVMNLVGDGMHNFLDGLIIAGSFLISPAVGMATTLAVVFHEIPQEIGDFGVLLHAGFSRTKALLFNFASALLAIFGLLLVVVFESFGQPLETIFAPLTIGGFLYIAGSDLVPEIKKETGLKKSLVQIFAVLLGMLIMYGLTFIK